MLTDEQLASMRRATVPGDVDRLLDHIEEQAARIRELEQLLEEARTDPPTAVRLAALSVLFAAMEWLRSPEDDTRLRRAVEVYMTERRRATREPGG